MKLILRELVVDFKTPDGQRLPALGPISLEILPGEFVCIVGPSGCGKSTLIRALAGLQRATSGSVTGDGLPITGPLSELAIMFQDANLMPWRTVIDNICLPLELAGVDKAQRVDVVRELLPQLHLEDFALSYPAELSGGMAQRVALGRVIVQQPRALLLDEPFGALDAMTREKISLELLDLWRKRRQTAVMVTHDINEAVLMADRVVVMSRRPGKLVADIAINLERPRTIDMIYHETFLRLVKRARAAIDRPDG